MQIFSLNWLSHKKNQKKNTDKKLKNARPHRHGNSLYNIYTYIYALLSKTQTTIRSTKTKNKLTKKKYMKTPNEKTQKNTWHETKPNQTPCHAYSVHNRPLSRTHHPQNVCTHQQNCFSIRIELCTSHKKKKTTLNLKTKPKPRCETQPKNNLNSKKRFKLNLISKKCKKNKYPNMATKKQTTKRFWLWIKTAQTKRRKPW